MICIRHFARVVVGGLICASLAAVAFAQDAPKADDKQIAGLVSKLGDKDFRTRDQAQKDLIAIGLPAHAAVQAALTSNDLETAQRAKLILSGIARACFDAASKKAQNNVLWSFPIKSGMVGSPLIKDGVAYVAGVDRAIYAVDLKTGKGKWSQAKDLPGDDNNPVSQIALSDAGVIIAFTDGTLAGLEFASGKVLWKREPQNAAGANGANNAPVQMLRMQQRMRMGIAGNAPVLPIAAQGLTVYLVEGSQIVILDAKKGEKKSAIDLPNSIVPISRLWVEGGRVLFLASDQQCHCYTLADQKELWKIAIGTLANSVISSDGKTYIVGPGMATAVDSATGNKLWSCQADDPSNQSYYAMAGGRAADSLKIMDGLLYRFGFDGARLAAIDLKETKFKWNQPIEYWHDAQEDEQQNLPGNAIQRQMIIRAAMINGRMMNSFQGGGMTCAAIEGMTAYVGTPYGLYAVGLSDAVPLWRLKGVSASGAPVAQGGVLYFGTGDESAAVAGVGGPGMAVAVGPAVGLPGVAGAVNAAQPTTAPAADGKVNLEPGLHALKIK